jgi:predicted exporter
MSSFLPLDPTPEQRVLVDQLRDGAISRVILVAIEGGDARSRAAASNAVAKSLASSPLVAGGHQRQRRHLREGARTCCCAIAMC